MNMYGGVEVQLHTFLTVALDRDECSATKSGHFTPAEKAPVSTGWEAG
jgi:hypothetical protein